MAHAALICCFAFEMRLVIKKKKRQKTFLFSFFICQLDAGSTEHALIRLPPGRPERGLGLLRPGLPSPRPLCQRGRAGRAAQRQAGAKELWAGTDPSSQTEKQETPGNPPRDRFHEDDVFFAHFPRSFHPI